MTKQHPARSISAWRSACGFSSSFGRLHVEPVSSLFETGLDQRSVVPSICRGINQQIKFRYGREIERGRGRVRAILYTISKIVHKKARPQFVKLRSASAAQNDRGVSMRQQQVGQFAAHITCSAD